MKIVKTYKESLPAVKLVGKRFTNEDRDATGTFATYWQQAFQESWFDQLKKGKELLNISDDVIGAMRMGKQTGEFEYWIGIFLATDTNIPAGFEAINIPAGEVGITWLYGNEKSGELYSAEASNLSMKAFAEKGWKYSEQGWFFERYNASRFTVPDEKGNVILDICAYLV